MTRVRYDEVPLPRLVHASHGIFVVRPADPPTRIERVTILPEGSAFAGRNRPPYYEPPYHDPDPGPHGDKNYPPYPRGWHRGHVLAVLKALPALVLRDPLEICEADSGSREELHRRYYLLGHRKSPIYEAYRPAREIRAREERLVFCTQRGGRLGLTVAEAFETIERRSEVEALIAAGPPAGDVELAPS